MHLRTTVPPFQDTDPASRLHETIQRICSPPHLVYADTEPQVAASVQNPAAGQECKQSEELGQDVPLRLDHCAARGLPCPSSRVSPTKMTPKPSKRCAPAWMVPYRRKMDDFASLDDIDGVKVLNYSFGNKPISWCDPCDQAISEYEWLQ